MRLNWQSWVSAAVLCGLTAPALAAREFTPQAGLWMISSERNGEPGRGFSLDVQGNTVFMQVFNYEKSGAATFHTAVGKLDDSASMTVPLLRFKGGRYFGGPAQVGVEDGTVGNVSLRFIDGLNGTVQFPGEPIQPIARFLVPEKQPFWWTTFSADPPSGSEGFRSMQWVATSKNGIRYRWNAKLGTGINGAFQLNLHSTFEWGGSLRTFDCKMQAEDEVFDCLPTSNSFNVEKPDMPLEIARLKFRLVGRDVIGEIQPAWDLAQRMTMNGWQDGSYSCDGSSSWCNSPSQRSSRVYATSSEMESVCITGYCSGYQHVMLQPNSGAWVIDDERTGQPGRGVFLDVQENTIIVQTSDYLASGEPTFHLGASSLQGANTSKGDTTASFSLFRYKNGRYFGGPAQPGVEAVKEGGAYLAFSPNYGNNDAFSHFATGRVTLPGEESKRMRRLQLEATPIDGIEHMLGDYFIGFSGMSVSSSHLRHVRLTKVEGDVAQNDDGSVRCQQRDASNRFRMSCVLYETTSITPGVLNGKGQADVKVSPFNTAGDDFNRQLRTRDAHGNWLGLGKVNLPGLAISAD